MFQDISIFYIFAKKLWNKPFVDIGATTIHVHPISHVSVIAYTEIGTFGVQAIRIGCTMRVVNHILLCDIRLRWTTFVVINTTSIGCRNISTFTVAFKTAYTVLLWISNRWSQIVETYMIYQIDHGRPKFGQGFDSIFQSQPEYRQKVLTPGLASVGVKSSQVDPSPQLFWLL